MHLYIVGPTATYPMFIIGKEFVKQLRCFQNLFIIWYILLTECSKLHG